MNYNRFSLKIWKIFSECRCTCKYLDMNLIHTYENLMSIPQVSQVLIISSYSSAHYKIIILISKPDNLIKTTTFLFYSFMCVIRRGWKDILFAFVYICLKLCPKSHSHVPNNRIDQPYFYPTPPPLPQQAI